MKLLLPLLAGAAYGATTLTNVACNGKDKITFTLTKDAGSALGDIQTMGCPNTNGAMDATSYTKVGDVYNFDFNPYTSCMNTPDANNAATYSVDFKMLFSNSQTIEGQTLYFSGDQVDLKCTFKTTYTLTSDLGGVSLDGDQLVGETFSLTFEMVRTKADYTTTETGNVIANSDIFHRISSTTATNLGNTDFAFPPSRIRLEKKNADPTKVISFDLWKHDMSTCGHSEIGFEMDYANGKWTFKYKAFLLDTEQGASAEYQIVADMELCNSAATHSKCTGAMARCVTKPHSTFNHAILGGNWQLVRRAHEWMHPATDWLRGTEEYGTYINDPTHPSTFSMKWDTIPFTEFLFITGDQTLWIHCTKEAVIGEYYSQPTQRPVISSSNDPNPHTLPFGHLEHSNDDPWVSLKWGTDTDRQPLYGGNSYCKNNYRCWASWVFSNKVSPMNKRVQGVYSNDHHGVNVFIR